jgi:hypothetical protein
MGCQKIVCLLAVFAVSVGGYEFTLQNKIKSEPHLLSGVSTLALEASYSQFYSIPDLAEVSASFCIPFKRGSAAISVSSLALDSIYRELIVVGGVGYNFARFSGGLSFGYQVKDIGGDEEYGLKQMRLSASLYLVRNCQLFCSLPSISIDDDNFTTLHRDWVAGVFLKQDTLGMQFAISVSQTVNNAYSVRFFQNWKISNNLLLYGSVDSEPLKFCLGISVFCRRIGAGMDHAVFPGIGTVQSFYTRYGSAGE